MPDFAQYPNTYIKPKTGRDLDIDFWNKVRLRLKEEDLLDADVDENKVIAAIKNFTIQRGISTQLIGVDELLEEYEDMVFGSMMEEAMNDPDNSESVDEDIIMQFLRSR